MFTRRRLSLATLTVLLFAAGTPFALAAKPQGGTFIGTLGTSSSVQPKKVTLKVAPGGRSATAALYCGTSVPVSTIGRFAITKGRFRAVKRTGSQTVWALSGRFTTATGASATLTLPAVCDGHGGQLTLTHA